MGYRLPEHHNLAAIEVFPIRGKKAEVAAMTAGMRPVAMPCLHVTGPNRPGLGYAIASRIAAAGININFLVTQVMGRQFTSVVGFDTEVEAAVAAKHIKAAARTPAKPKRAAARKRKTVARKKAKRAR
jgi:hypothetical protein